MHTKSAKPFMSLYSSSQMRIPNYRPSNLLNIEGQTKMNNLLVPQMLEKGVRGQIIIGFVG
jgi:hypothetical protein